MCPYLTQMWPYTCTATVHSMLVSYIDQMLVEHTKPIFTNNGATWQTFTLEVTQYSLATQTTVMLPIMLVYSGAQRRLELIDLYQRSLISFVCRFLAWMIVDPSSRYLFTNNSYTNYPSTFSITYSALRADTQLKQLEVGVATAQETAMPIYRCRCCYFHCGTE